MLNRLCVYNTHESGFFGGRLFWKWEREDLFVVF